ncbi:hypothetical protein EC523_13315, partial [Avibacterium paragallinarum]
KSDPQSALAYLPHALSGLDQSLGAFGELVGMRGAFDSVRPYLGVVGEFVEAGQAIYDALALSKTHFEQSNATGWENWFVPADNAFADAVEHIDNLATTTAEMTAWVVLRNDEECDDANRD